MGKFKQKAAGQILRYVRELNGDELKNPFSCNREIMRPPRCRYTASGLMSIKVHSAVRTNSEFFGSAQDRLEIFEFEI